MEAILSIAMGIGLSAACGFRVFLPMFIAGLAVASGHAEVSEGFAWIGSDAALLAFGTASVLEIGAYYIPWVDHLLDMAAAPAAVAAGILLTAGFLPEWSPWLRWTLAVIVGGSVTGTVQTGTMALRAISTTFSGGLTNSAVSTGEATGSAVVTVASLAAPVLTAIVLFIIAGAVYRRWIRPSGRHLEGAAPSAP